MISAANVVIKIQVQQDKDNARVQKKIIDDLKDYEKQGVKSTKVVADEQAKADKALMARGSEILRDMNARSSRQRQYAADNAKAQREDLKYWTDVSRQMDAQQKKIRDAAYERERIADSFHRAAMRRHGDRQRMADGAGGQIFGGIAGAARGALEFAAGNDLANGGDIKKFAGRISQVEGAYHALASSEIIQGLLATRAGQDVRAATMQRAAQVGGWIRHGVGGALSGMGLKTLGGIAGSSALAPLGVGAATILSGAIGGAAAFGSDGTRSAIGGGAHGLFRLGRDTGGGIGEHLFTPHLAIADTFGWGNRGERRGSVHDAINQEIESEKRLEKAEKHRQELLAANQSLVARRVQFMGLSRAHEVERAGLGGLSAIESAKRQRDILGAHAGVLRNDLANESDPQSQLRIAQQLVAATNERAQKEREIVALQKQGAAAILNAYKQDRATRFADIKNARSAQATAGAGSAEERATARSLLDLYKKTRNIDAMTPEQLETVKRFGGQDIANEITKKERARGAAQFPELAADEDKAKKSQGVFEANFGGLFPKGQFGSTTANLQFIIQSDQGLRPVLDKISGELAKVFDDIERTKKAIQDLENKNAQNTAAH